MDKILNIPESLIIKNLDNDYLMTGNVIIALQKGNIKVFGNLILPAMIYRTSLSQLLLLVYIHNNSNKFNYDQISELLPIINFKYNEKTKHVKDNHIKIILSKDNNKFINFINDLLVNILNAYIYLDDDQLEIYMNNFNYRELDDLRFEDGINIIHSIYMRAIIALILSKKDIDKYIEYEHYMLPMSKIHKLYEDNDVLTRAKELAAGIDDDPLNTNESCLFNELLVQHVFINMGIIFEGLIRSIVLKEKEMIKASKFIKDAFSDYDKNSSPSDRLQYAISKLINLCNSEKCIYVLNGKTSRFLNSIFTHTNYN